LEATKELTKRIVVGHNNFSPTAIEHPRYMVYLVYHKVHVELQSQVMLAGSKLYYNSIIKKFYSDSEQEICLWRSIDMGHMEFL